MNHQPQPRQPNPSDPQQDAIDLLIEAHFHASPGDLLPSSGFAQSVMQSIHAEAVEPPPIEFPWRRILPAAVVILCALLTFSVSLVRNGIHFATASPAANTLHFPNLAAVTSSGSRDAALCWILLAVCLAGAAAATSFHLTGRQE